MAACYSQRLSKLEKTVIETSCVPPLYCHGQSLKQVGGFMFVACYD